MGINPTNSAAHGNKPSYNPVIEAHDGENGQSIFSKYDTDRDNIITVAEQKASIANQLANVWTSSIARFFKDSIAYTKDNIRNVTLQVLFRINRALNYIEYCKKNNIDIFMDNEGTGVEDKDGELKEYSNSQGNYTSSEKLKSSIVNEDGTHTNIYEDGSTTIWDQNNLRLELTDKTSDGSSYKVKYNYNEDGSYNKNITFDDNKEETWIAMYNQNNEHCCIITPNGNYKFTAKQGETFDQTLKRMGITDPKDIAAVKRANPKATKRGAFTIESGDVYIPKAVIENMKQNGTYNQDKLLSAEYY